MAVFRLAQFARRARAPMPVLKPPELNSKAPKPNAVLDAPALSAKALVPPAVFSFASLRVGLHPGATQVGLPQLGVMFIRMTRPAITGTKRANGFMKPPCAG